MEGWDQNGSFERLTQGRGGVDSIGAGYGPVAGSCEYGDDPLGSSTTELVTSPSLLQLSVNMMVQDSSVSNVD
jgi:hypothetical protein